MFAARSGTEIESADDDVSCASACRKLRIVVFHNDLSHHLGRHAVAIGVVLAVDRIGVDVILRQEDESTFYPLRKPRQDFHALVCVPIAGELLVLSSQAAIGELTWPGDVTCGTRCRHDFGTGQITLCVARSHAALKIPIGGGDADFSLFQKPSPETDARSATGRERNCSRVEQSLPHATLLRLLLYPGTRRSQIKLHPRGDSLPAQNARCRFQILDS